MSEADDYLPLPISEEYQLPRKRRRQADQSRRPDAAQAEASPSQAGMLTAQQAALKQAGLGDLDSDGSAGHEQMQADPKGEGLQQPGSSKQSLKGRTGVGPTRQRPVGPVFPRTPTQARTQEPGKPKRPQAAHRGGTAVNTFDFAAAKAAATGLDMAAMIALPAKASREQKSASVRGGRTHGRTGRDDGARLLAP